MSTVLPINSNMNDRPYFVAFLTRYTDLPHQFAIANCDLFAVNNSNNTIAANFLYVCHSALIDLALICLTQTLTDRMR